MAVYLIGAAGGAIIVLVIWAIVHFTSKPTYAGTLVVDTSDPNGPSLFVALNAPVAESIMGKRTVIMDVKNSRD